MGLSLPLLLLSKSNFNSKCTLCVLPVCGDFKRKWKQWRVNYTQTYPKKGITWLCNHNLINNAPSSLKLLQEIELQNFAMSQTNGWKWKRWKVTCSSIHILTTCFLGWKLKPMNVQHFFMYYSLYISNGLWYFCTVCVGISYSTNSKGCKHHATIRYQKILRVFSRWSPPRILVLSESPNLRIRICMT